MSGWATPEINDRIVSFCRENPHPENGNHAVQQMIIREFGLFVGVNQIAGRVHKLGVMRGKPRLYHTAEARLAALAEREATRVNDGAHHKMSEAERAARAEARRLLKAEVRRVRSLDKKRVKDEEQRRRRRELPTPEIVTPLAARQHDIAIARPVITRSPNHPAHRQHISTVPKVTLDTIRPPSMFSNRVYRIPTDSPAPIPRTSSRTHACCWPIGDPGTPNFRYCDAPHNNLNRSYCDDHMKIAYPKAKAA